MSRIENMNDFLNFASNITSFSHAYLFNVNSLEQSMMYAKTFAKLIILGKDFDNDDNSDISYQIDMNEFDDLYIVNPDTIGINTDEINKLLLYMETKSLRPNGKRVYIIVGFERLSRNISNKILKFLEEPSENIYGILLTENYSKILPTIISRCQVFNFTYPVDNIQIDKINLMLSFLDELNNKGYSLIAYESKYFANYLKDRVLLFDLFEILEKILSETLNEKSGFKYDKLYFCSSFEKSSYNKIINALDLTNKAKMLIKSNINLNLLVDRYIIEMTEVLDLCKK